MENRSFDHLLGWLPGADGKQAGLSSRISPARITPPGTRQRLPGLRYMDPAASMAGRADPVHGGKGDGFLFTQVQRPRSRPRSTSGRSATSARARSRCSARSPPVHDTRPLLRGAQRGHVAEPIYQVAGTTDIDVTGFFLPDGRAAPTRRSRRRSGTDQRRRPDRRLLLVRRTDDQSVRVGQVRRRSPSGRRLLRCTPRRDAAQPHHRRARLHLRVGSRGHLERRSPLRLDPLRRGVHPAGATTRSPRARSGTRPCWS